MAESSSSGSRLAPPSHFDIDMNEKAELEGSTHHNNDYDQFLNQGSTSSRSGLSSSASSITAFDPNSSANREKAYHSDQDDDDYHKDFSSSTPFLSQHRHSEDEEKAPAPQGPEHVTWMSLPRKGQLLILFLCRLVDFLQVATLQAYIFYQLKHMAQQQMLEDESTSTFCLHYPRRS